MRVSHRLGASIRAMERAHKITVVVSALVLLFAFAVGPAGATEAGGNDEPAKIELPQRQHDFVGLLILGALGVGAAFALNNARKQLRGDRKQATGEFRWR